MTISLSQAFAQWNAEIRPSIPDDDCPALAESWNDYTDSLQKDGELCALQYHYAPAYDDRMPGEGSQFDALRDDRAFILECMGVTLSATFVPFSQSRNKTEDRPSLNWRVTLKKDGREVIATDYMQGCAHCPAYKNPSKLPSGKRDEYATQKRIREECETGKKIPPPHVTDVFYSLLCDASALDSGDFSDWCADLGYSDDSISARAIYDACIATAIKLRGAFGEKTLADLRELFQDM